MTTNSTTITQRDDGVTLIAAYHFFVALLFLFGTVLFAIPGAILGVVGVFEDAGAFIPMVFIVLLGGFLMLLCLLFVAIGYGLWTQRQWGRVGAIAVALVSLLGFPIGTIIGAATLWYLLKPEVAEKFQPATA